MYELLFDTAPDAMIVVDRSGRIVRANAQAECLFGYDAKQLLGVAIEALMPERARRAHESHRAGYAANPRVRPMGTGQELTGQKRDGQQFPVEIALSPIETADGKLFVASVRDVSETQRARQALVRARYDACVAQIGQLALAAPNLDSAIASTPQLVAEALGVDGVAILFRHTQLKRMQVRATYGVEHDLLDALPWPQLLAQSDFAQPRAAGLGVSGFRSHTLVPLIDLDEPAGALLVLHREPRQFDRDALHFLQSVANLLAAAMQRIRMEEQLSHAQRLEAIGQLTGGIAHDFNNLLTVISGNLQILEDELVDRPEAHAIIGSALRAVGRGAELTRKLLAFARRQRLAPRACDPPKLLDELGAMLRRTLGEAVQLTITCPTSIAQVFADPAQLDAALVNLALNARDAMPRGGRLSITAEERHIAQDEATEDLKSGDYVVFSVRDTGLGMTTDILARAFEPFFTTKEHGKGSGLGLSMVYGFVKQSGGHVDVDSQLGYGTRIDLYLPVAAGAGARSSETHAQSVSRGNECVLVVEDEVDVRDIAVRFLHSLGYTVLAAADADSALEQLVVRADIALLFSDVVLGTGMSGIELAAAARRLRPSLNVLLTSGYEHSSGGQTGIEFPLLQKPYRREELSVAVRAVLDQR
jgi:PAS domain S-box-containing protein